MLFEYFKILHADLNKIKYRLEPENSIYIPLFDSSVEHCISIHFLNNQGLTNSAFALARPALENYLRAKWIKSCASKKEIKSIIEGGNFPNITPLITKIEEGDSSFKETEFLTKQIKPLINNMHDFTHGGVQSIARQYKDSDTLSNERDIEEVESLIKLIVFISYFSYLELHQFIEEDSSIKKLDELRSEIFKVQQAHQRDKPVMRALGASRSDLNE